MTPAAGTVTFTDSTTFLAGNYFAFKAWDGTMSYPAAHSTGNKGSTGLTVLDKLDSVLFPAVNMGSEFCTFPTTFTVTPTDTAAYVYVY